VSDTRLAAWYNAALHDYARALPDGLRNIAFSQKTPPFQSSSRVPQASATLGFGRPAGRNGAKPGSRFWLRLVTAIPMFEIKRCPTIPTSAGVPVV
jgi:hypothetical protein